MDQQANTIKARMLMAAFRLESPHFREMANECGKQLLALTGEVLVRDGKGLHFVKVGAL